MDFLYLYLMMTTKTVQWLAEINRNTRIIFNSGRREIGLVLAISIFAKKDYRVKLNFPKSL